MKRIKNIFNNLKINKQLLITICGVFLLLLMCGGITFAIFNYSNSANNSNINSGYVSFTYIEPSNEYVVENALPMKDEEAMELSNYFEFSVTTTAKTNENDDNGVSLPYEITITESENNTLSSDQIKMYLTEVEGEKEIAHTIPTLVSNLEPSLYKNIGTKVGFNLHLHRNDNETITTKYRLRAWIDYDVDVSNWDTAGEFIYKFRVNVNGEGTYQGYETNASCFTYEKYDNNGISEYQITGYDFNKCDGKNVVIPSYIDEVVKNKEILAINWPSDEEFIEVYKDYYFTEDCSGYDDLSSCLEADGITDSDFETQSLSELAHIKSTYNPLIGENYYEYQDAIEDLQVMFSDLGMTVTFEYGEDMIITTPIKVSKIDSLANTSVVEVSADKRDSSIDNLNNIVSNKNIIKTANSSYIINSLIVPNDLIITNNAFSSVEIDNMIDKTGSFPASCFVYENNDELIKIKDYLCKGVLSLRVPSVIDNVSVKIIGDGAFTSDKLESVYLPETITTIGSSAFWSNNLFKINIPEGVTSIGGAAFAGNNLGSINIPTGITSIENQAFQANKLKSVIIPDGVTSIGYAAFSNNQLISISIPESVTAIGGSAFYGNQLTNVVIPNSVTEIGESTFKNNKIEKVIINNANVSIGEEAFANNIINNLDFGSGDISIDSYAFSNNKLKEVVFPENVNFTGGLVFATNPLNSIIINNASGLSTYLAFNGNKIYRAKDKNGNFPSSCFDYTSDGASITITKYKCVGVVAVNIPETIDGLPVKTIDNSSFSGKKLEKLIIPDNEITIKYNAFATNNLHSVIIPESTILSDSVFNGNKINKFVNENGDFPLICFGFDKRDITTYDLNHYYCEGAAKVIIPSHVDGVPVVSITNSAFKSKKVYNVVLPNTITTIGEYAFDHSDLNSLIIPSSVTKIDLYAFANNNLTSISIPDNVSSIGSYAFAHNKITKIKLSKKMTTIPNGCFYDNKLTEYTIPAHISIIDNQAFSHNRLEKINLSNVEIIEQHAFSYNELTTVVIPSSVTNINSYAFYKKYESSSNYSNTGLVKIVNKTGRAFDWKEIITGLSAEEFIEGTLEHIQGNVEIVAE